MARKKQKENSSSKKVLVSMDATVKKLESLLNDPQIKTWLYTGQAAGVRAKYLSINYNTLRNIVYKTPLFNAVINTRVGQLIPFCKRVDQSSSTQGAKGFKIIPVSSKVKKDDEKIDQLSTFFEQTGYQYNDDREDDLSDYCQMLIRDIIEIDQIATEIQYNRLKQPVAFWALDAASIYRVNKEDSRFDKEVAFVQMFEQKVYNQYTHSNLLFDYMNKRSDARFRGYGYSIVEMCIDLITVLLFGLYHNRDLFVKNKIPKGFISVMGDASDEQLDMIRRYWYAAMSGAGGEWNIPILPSGKEGVGMDFKSLTGGSNRDMEYNKSMLFVSSMIASVASIDLAELGIRADNSTSIINNQSDEPRLKSSQNRGLAALVAFIEQHLNKILRKITLDYRFEFVGLQTEDEEKRTQIDKLKVETYMTVNEIREERGLKPLKDEYADVILNPQAVQLFSSAKQQEQQAQQQQQGGGFGEQGNEDEEDDWDYEDEQSLPQEENTGDEEDQKQSDLGKALSFDFFKKLTGKKLKEVLQ